jgi:non-ribosomal peptide synthase protein (TIGR01720 family)
MDELKNRIANLSPAKRAFLDQRVTGLAKNTVISRNLERDLAPLAFRSDGEGTPLFLLHYLTPSQVLAKYLGPDRPVFGIDSAFEEEMYLWEEAGRIAVSVEELARRCLAELQAAQPRGPYCLAGFCFGGSLAFEVAKQLRKRGEPVAFLGLLDSFYLPGVNPISVPWLTTSRANERTSGMTEAEKEFSRRVTFMREIVKPYKSEPYPGGAVLFRAMANRDPSLGANGWDKIIVGDLQLEDCQSTRMGFFEEPFVGELAARLDGHLSRVDEHYRRGEIDPKVISVPNHARPEPNDAFVEPRTPVERALAEIWSAVLQVEQVGVHDRFFELGGDSILSIQVIARAKKAGLRLTLKQIFQHQTIAELALVAEAVTHPYFEQRLITGEVPLTPIQKWFFEQAYADNHHWNQAALLELKQDLDSALLDKAVRQLVLHHDALRLRFQRSNSGWTQFNAGGEEAVKLTLVDLAGTPEEKQISAMETAAAELQGNLNLSHGPVISAAVFIFGCRRPSRLLLAIHHLAVDGVSWRILLEDLQVLCEQLRSGGTVRLPDKTLSFRKWAQELAEYARSATLEHEADYWLAVSSAKSSPIPMDFSGGENTEASARIVSVSLDAEETPALLQKVPQAYNTEINDVLLAALGLALTSWIGQPVARINLEGHGREELSEGIDLSRTVGWFTTMFPVNLDLRGTAGPGEVLKSIKEQLRRIPQRGIGYGILRYLRGDESLAAQLRSAPQPEIAFNYLGQFDQMTSASPFVSVEGPIGPTRSPLAQRSHLLSINSLVTNGRLRVDWGYSAGVHRRSTIERLAQSFIEALRSLIHHCTSASAGGYTPSDFIEAGLDQQELDSLIAELGERAI